MLWFKKKKSAPQIIPEGEVSEPNWDKIVEKIKVDLSDFEVWTREDKYSGAVLSSKKYGYSLHTDIYESSSSISCSDINTDTSFIFKDKAKRELKAAFKDTYYKLIQQENDLRRQKELSVTKQMFPFAFKS